LAVVGQPDESEELPPAIATLPHVLVLTAGRPVLVVPYAGKFAKIGTRVLIAWNASREAVRAVNDAMPILQRAKKVIVLSVNPTKKDHIPGADIAAHIARHGCKVEATHTVAKDIEVGDALLGAITDYGADLLVMGAWGHSRMRELVLGGATRELMGQMTVPVLLSH
jgi:nucleotide-binding universal stress UspA family protein